MTIEKNKIDMKVLFITNHYLDQMLGGPNASKCFLHSVSSLYPDTTVIYPEHNEYVTPFDFMSECRDIKYQPVIDIRSKFRKLCDVYLGKLHRFGRFVKEHLRNNHYDIIFIDHSIIASSGILESAIKNGAQIVTIHHNVESQYLADNKPSILYRYPYIHYALKAERKSIIASNLNLTITEADRNHFMSAYPQKADSFCVVGVSEYELHAPTTIKDKVDGYKFIISGAMSALQTETAILVFLKEYMPLLNEVCPSAELIITGRNPSQRIYDAAAPYSNIKIVPNPKDIMDVITKGNYYICPIHTGSGLKLRSMDALRIGLPVLAHQVSTHGYEGIQRDGYLFSYSSKENFKTALKKLIQLHDCRQQVIDSYYSHFSFEAGKERMKVITAKIAK